MEYPIASLNTPSFPGEIQLYSSSVNIHHSIHESDSYFSKEVCLSPILWAVDSLLSLILLISPLVYLLYLFLMEKRSLVRKNQYFEEQYPKNLTLYNKTRKSRLSKSVSVTTQLSTCGGFSLKCFENER